MLWTDKRVVTADDLNTIESEVADVAETEAVSLDAFLAQQVDEFGGWLTNKTIAVNGYFPPVNQPYSPTLGLTNLLGHSTERQKFTYSQIVVNNPDVLGAWSELKRLAVYTVLANFYRQVSRRKGNDRYEDKFEDYRADVKNMYRPRFMKRGLPLVNRPMPRPGAALEPEAGVWSAANVAPASGDQAQDSDPQWDIAITYIDQNVQFNAESAPSETVAIRCPASDQARVSIATLTPPDGTVAPRMLANTPIPPLNASGWNVYAAAHGGVLMLQNAAPIPIATQTYDVALPVVPGRAAGAGQYPDEYATIGDFFNRG